MPEDDRVNLDDLGDVQKNLLEDVQAATEIAKKRKAKDKVRDVEAAQKGRDKTIMVVIIVLAAVVIFGATYWMMFARPEPSVLNQSQRPISSPMTTPTYRPPVQKPPTSQRYAPPRPITPNMPRSEPVHRNPTDTYDNNSGGGRM